MRESTEDFKPCPFCGYSPFVRDQIVGSCFEYDCQCGLASFSIQISELMTHEEIQEPLANQYQYQQKYIDRARKEAINQWNTRKGE